MEARTPEDVPAASTAPAPKAGQRLHRAGPARPEPGCPSRAGRCLGVPSSRTSSHPGRGRPRAKAAGQPGTQRLGEPGPHSTSGVGGSRSPLRMPRTRVRLSVRRGAPRGTVRTAAGLEARRWRYRGIAGPGRVGDRGARSLPSAPRATGTVLRGSGSSTIVSGRSRGGRGGGGSRAPGPAPSRRCHPAKAGGGMRGEARSRAKLRTGTAPAG